MLANVVIFWNRFQTGAGRSMDNISTMEKFTVYKRDPLPKANKVTNSHGAYNDSKTSTGSISSEDQAGSVSGVSEGIFGKGMRNLNSDSVDNKKKTKERQHEGKESELLQSDLAASNDNLTIASISVSKRLAKQATTISEMNSLLLQSPLSSHSMMYYVAIDIALASTSSYPTYELALGSLCLLLGESYELMNASSKSLGVSPEVHFQNDLGLDSLDNVEIVMALEEEFKLQIPDLEADRIDSCNLAIEYIYNHPMAG
ncbi:hypothetical protein FNV43_RR11240 [Rhamnella rubrinervis]|uniref:Acyl carrier protein n=1 Tax=Rhamnella rubrinervis TaxID=2594499 RepID=A0A8K0MHF8_9ROSA|nr:hypothetical protein FNV43_RR11240 [Rhamnella rubrinervis]